VLRAAARRLVLIFVFVGGGAVLVGASVGLIVGSSLNRSISLGLYLVGCVLLLGGFLMGNRGPLRRVGTEEGPMTVGRALRSATADEMRESINLSFLLVTVGLVLLLLAVAIDKRVDLV
jgi:hypothetical protein